MVTRTTVKETLKKITRVVAHGIGMFAKCWKVSEIRIAIAVDSFNVNESLGLVQVE